MSEFPFVLRQTSVPLHNVVLALEKFEAYDFFGFATGKHDKHLVETFSFAAVSLPSLVLCVEVGPPSSPPAAR